MRELKNRNKAEKATKCMRCKDRNEAEQAIKSMRCKDTNAWDMEGRKED